jgi:hypothetical protein
METALISALIAAGVSIISVVFNLLIARVTLKGTKSQIKFQSALKYVDESITILKKYMKEIEKVRIACWGLELSFLNKVDVDAIKDHAEEFKMEFDKFFADWSDAKGEMEDIYLMGIRSMRHGLKNNALELTTLFRTWTLPRPMISQQPIILGGSAREKSVRPHRPKEYDGSQDFTC